MGAVMLSLSSESDSRPSDMHAALKGMHRVMVSPVASGVTRVGFIGTGVMGASMAGHILAAGYPLTVYNRSAAKTVGLAALGAGVAATPRAVAEASDVVFSIVGFPSDVRSVLLDADTGVLAGLRPGGVVVDMTTSEPALAVEIAA